MQFPKDFVSKMIINPIRISTTHLHRRKSGGTILVVTHSDRDLLEVYDDEYLLEPAYMTNKQLEDYLGRETFRKLAKISRVSLN